MSDDLSQAAHADHGGLSIVGDYNIVIKADVIEGDVVLGATGPELSQPPHIKRLPQDNWLWLRATPTEFLDRTNEITELAGLLRQQKRLLINLYGAQGIGKTELITEVMYAVDPSQFADGIVPLKVYTSDYEKIADEIFTSFFFVPKGIFVSDSIRRRYLKDTKALIILDPDDVDLQEKQIERLLSIAPNCSFVVISRGRKPAPRTEPMELSGLPCEHAIQLFENRLGRALSGQEVEIVTEICENLECNPASIEWTAERFRSGRTSLDQILSGTKLRLIGRIRRAIQSEENRQLDAMRRIAIVATPDLESDHLILLAVLGPDFVKSIPKQALRELAGPLVIGPFENRLAYLRDRGLIESFGPRYRVHPSLKHWAQTKWVDKDLERKVAVYFCNLAEQIQHDDNLLEQDGDNILAAATWLLDHWYESLKTADLQLIVRTSKALNRWLMLTGRWEHWQTSLRQALHAARALGDQEAIAWAKHQLGTQALALGRIPEATRYLQPALRTRRRIGIRTGAEITWHNLKILTTTTETRPVRTIMTLAMRFFSIPLVIASGILISLTNNIPLIVVCWSALLSLLIIGYAIRSLLVSQRWLYSVANNYEAVVEREGLAPKTVIGPAGGIWRRPFSEYIRAMVPMHELSCTFYNLKVAVDRNTRIEIAIFVRYIVSDPIKATYSFFDMGDPKKKKRQPLTEPELVKAWESHLRRNVQSLLVDHLWIKKPKFDVAERKSVQTFLHGALSKSAAKVGIRIEWISILDVTTG